jgi:hypothetical protein
MADLLFDFFVCFIRDEWFALAAPAIAPLTIRPPPRIGVLSSKPGGGSGLLNRRVRTAEGGAPIEWLGPARHDSTKLDLNCLDGRKGEKGGLEGNVCFCGGAKDCSRKEFSFFL